jgi:hypothetical protein
MLMIISGSLRQFIAAIIGRFINVIIRRGHHVDLPFLICKYLSFHMIS